MKNSLQLLELKGKPIKLFNPNRNANDIIAVLPSIDATIQNEKSILHARAKLKNYPALEKYFEDHLTEGLYMLQFRKCDNDSCCVKKTELPPPLPAPVLEPAGDHYLLFTKVYGKIATTEKDCPSLIQKGEKKKEQSVKFKLIASHVVSTLQCVQCEKRRCVFTLDSQITPKIDAQYVMMKILQEPQKRSTGLLAIGIKFGLTYSVQKRASCGET